MYNSRRHVNGKNGFDDGQPGRSDSWRECWNHHSELRKVGSLSDLRPFQFSPRIYEAVYCKDIGCLPGISEFSGELNERNYCDVLEAFLRSDEAHSAVNFLRKSDMSSQHLVTTYDDH
jgi:hypothetical protein